MDDLKWHMPGWRIEQKYSPGVLIGNWDEDRYRFQKVNLPHNSTHKRDYRAYPSYSPDVILRRRNMLSQQGLPKDLLFTHHGRTYSNNMISWYDEHYNMRERDNKLPELRQWDSHRVGWHPEKTDYPLQGAPTNFGLLEKIQSRQEQAKLLEGRGDYMSTYSGDFILPPRSALTATRFATPIAESTTMHRQNLLNKNLLLRNGSCPLQSPQKLAQPGDIHNGASCQIPAIPVPVAADA